MAESIISTILNTVLYLIAVFCIGNLIVGAFLNAIRESKNKPKKKRTSIIIFDISMIVVCVAAYRLINPVTVSNSAEETHPDKYAAIYDWTLPSGKIVSNKVWTVTDSLESCSEALTNAIYSDHPGSTYTKVGCGKNCALEEGAKEVLISTCEDLYR